MTACMYGSLDIVHLLLCFDADVKAYDKVLLYNYHYHVGVGRGGGTRSRATLSRQFSFCTKSHRELTALISWEDKHYHCETQHTKS